MKIVKRAGACALEFWPKRTRACNVRVCDPKIRRNSHFSSMLQKEFESIVKQNSATKKIDFLRLVQGIEVSTQSGSGFPTCPINIMVECYDRGFIGRIYFEESLTILLWFQSSESLLL